MFGNLFGRKPRRDPKAIFRFWDGTRERGMPRCGCLESAMTTITWETQ